MSVAGGAGAPGGRWLGEIHPSASSITSSGASANRNSASSARRVRCARTGARDGRPARHAQRREPPSVLAHDVRRSAGVGGGGLRGAAAASGARAGGGGRRPGHDDGRAPRAQAAAETAPAPRRQSGNGSSSGASSPRPPAPRASSACGRPRAVARPRWPAAPPGRRWVSPPGRRGDRTRRPRAARPTELVERSQGTRSSGGPPSPGSTPAPPSRRVTSAEDSSMGAASPGPGRAPPAGDRQRHRAASRRGPPERARSGPNWHCRPSSAYSHRRGVPGLEILGGIDGRVDVLGQGRTGERRARGRPAGSAPLMILGRSGRERLDGVLRFAGASPGSAAQMVGAPLRVGGGRRRHPARSTASRTASTGMAPPTRAGDRDSGRGGARCSMKARRVDGRDGRGLGRRGCSTGRPWPARVKTGSPASAGSRPRRPLQHRLRCRDLRLDGCSRPSPVRTGAARARSSPGRRRGAGPAPGRWVWAAVLRRGRFLGACSPVLGPGGGDHGREEQSSRDLRQLGPRARRRASVSRRAEQGRSGCVEPGKRRGRHRRPGRRDGAWEGGGVPPGRGLPLRTSAGSEGNPSLSATRLEPGSLLLGETVGTSLLAEGAQLADGRAGVGHLSRRV